MREMKDSGVEWIGAIPADWSISRIKYVAEFDPVCNKSAINGSSLITYTPMDCIKHGWFINNSAPLESLSTSLTTYQEGDIVMAKVTPCFENGNIAIMEGLHNGFGMGSSELFVFRPKSIDTKFFFYWLQNNAFVQKAKATMTGTGGLKRVSPVFTRNCPIHIPPYKDQNRIALYLDGKLAQVNILIANVQAQIEKLKAYKQSLITEVVTKGLDPTVPMKDSGIEWIGEIPVHWDVLKTGRLFKENNRKPFGNDTPLSLSQVDGLIATDDMKESSLKTATYDNWKRVEIGDLVLNRFKAHLGVLFAATLTGIVSFHYGVYNARCAIVPKYYEYLYHSDQYRAILGSASNGMVIGLQNLSNLNFYSTYSLYPTCEDQEKIVAYLDEKCSQIAQLIAIKQAKIEKLEQYKRSLIYEYVTGKKEVPAHT